MDPIISLLGGVHHLLASALHAAPRGWCTVAELMSITNLSSIDTHHALAELIRLNIVVQTQGTLSLCRSVPRQLTACALRARESLATK